tara:strand:- start:125 stop:1303 length:1179 start_codon:yes stop_codon:yes gene_type:complete
MPTAIAGLRGSGEFTTDFRPTNYRELFTMLEPNGTAPLQALLAMTASESTNDPKFNHFRDETPDRVMKVNGAVASTSTTAITIDADTDVQFAVTGTLVSNLDTGEVMRCTADSSGTGLVVERNIGGTSHQIADNANLAIIGFADKEGGNSPTPVSFDATTDFNYTQIFKTAVSVSRTLQNTALRTGDKEQEVITKGLKLHMSDIERAMFWGIRHESNGSTSQPTRYTGGLTSQITNVTDVASAFATNNIMTEKEFDQTLIESIFAFGGKEKICFMGARAASNFMTLAKNRWSPTQVEGSYGVSMSRYSTFAGDLMCYLHPMFRQIPGMDDAMIILDVPYLKYRYLDNSDTMLQRDIQATDFDGKKHQYLTECGLEMTQAQVHHYIKNWAAVA